MKLAVVGTRFDETDPAHPWRLFIEEKLNDLVYELDFTEIVSGGAFGTDTVAELYIEANNSNYDLAGDGTRKTFTVFEPDWTKYGKGAGFVRNSEIVKYCDLLVAFWDGVSGGTYDSIIKALNAKKLHKVYYF